ncbi:hypothetical protein Krac_11728 [Ktedonobacter racemifer DSM 44963]|uniref:Uncharacterized protein n=1 Tax=Ktedonobacter racemifer DSM 44963 TaxID=485913 RepID=D6TD69_KTERA|nr:hypothetical protein Krac_11728 [Ktedonobacter racemifer DSM 44963]
MLHQESSLVHVGTEDMAVIQCARFYLRTALSGRNFSPGASAACSILISVHKLGRCA